jgi:hypothetical protein
MPAGVSAWTPLANITLSSTQLTVTFSSISSAYRDLRLVYRGNANGYSGAAPSLRINGDDTVAYPTVLFTGDGTTGVYASTLNFAQIPINDANYMSPAAAMVCLVDIFDYSATNKHKSVLSRAHSAQGANTNTGRWPNNAAITSLTLAIAFGSSGFVAGSTFALYGMSA